MGGAVGDSPGGELGWLESPPEEPSPEEPELEPSLLPESSTTVELSSWVPP